MKKEELTTITIPRTHKSLLLRISEWVGELERNELGYIKPTWKTQTLRNIVKIEKLPKESAYIKEKDFLLYPTGLIPGGYALSFKITQELVDDFESIYSPSSLTIFLNNLPCYNSIGKMLNYQQVWRWPINYYNRQSEIKEKHDGRTTYIKKQLDQKNVAIMKKYRETIQERIKKANLEILGNIK